MKNQHPLTEAEIKIKQLEECICQESWRGNYFGENGVLMLQRQLITLMKKSEAYNPHKLSGISSVHYSASGHAFAQARFYKPLWYLKAFLELKQARKVSDLFALRVPVPEMTSGEISVRSSILIKTNSVDFAFGLILEALDRPNLDYSTKVLLLCNSAECAFKLDNLDEADRIYELVKKLDPSSDPKVAVRVYRALGVHNLRKKRFDEAYVDFKAAQKLAEKNDLKDQLIKLKPFQLRAEKGLSKK